MLAKLRGEEPSYTSTSTMESGVELPLETKKETPFDLATPLLGIFLKELKIAAGDIAQQHNPAWKVRGCEFDSWNPSPSQKKKNN